MSSSASRTNTMAHLHSVDACKRPAYTHRSELARPSRRIRLQQRHARRGPSGLPVDCPLEGRSRLW